MKTKISTNETDLKSTYILFSLIPIGFGVIFLSSYFIGNDSFTRNNFIIYFSLAQLTIGLTMFLLFNLYIPYCYKIEIDNDKLYITKTEAILLTQIETTIELEMSLIKNINKSFFVGFQIFNSDYDLYYIHFREKTELGNKIAFLCDSSKPHKLFFPTRAKIKN